MTFDRFLRAHWLTWTGRRPPRRLRTAMLCRGVIDPPRAVVLVWEGSRAPVVVCKLSPEDDDVFLRTEVDNLTLLRPRLSRRMATTIPEALGLHHHGEMSVGVFTAMEGATPRLPETSRPTRTSLRVLGRYLREVRSWSTSLHEETQSVAERWQPTNSVDRFVERVELDGRASEVAAAFRARVATLDVVMAPGWQHGDVASGNILLHDTPDRLAVVDWELASPARPPWFDVCYLWLAFCLLERHRHPGADLRLLIRALYGRSISPVAECFDRELFSEWPWPVPPSVAIVITAMDVHERSRAMGRAGHESWADLIASCLEGLDYPGES
jgi:hypothetical protein